MKVLITGATGFLGKELLHRLPETVTEIRILTRDPKRVAAPAGSRIQPFTWDAENVVAPATALQDIDVVIHLAGENIGAGRWSNETKRRILDSRKLGTANLVAGINNLPRPPVLISASAIGFYGNGADTLLDESSAQGAGFLAEVCGVWEAEARKAKVSRLVIPRFGVILGPGGGAFGKLLPVFKAGVGGRIGDGRQWMSWVHRDDVIAFLLQAMTDPNINGVYNLVSPEPIRNENFTRTLGHVLHRPAILPVPAIALKITLGEMAEQTILASQRVSSAKLTGQGFTFQYPALEGALRQITAP